MAGQPLGDRLAAVASGGRQAVGQRAVGGGFWAAGQQSARQAAGHSRRAFGGRPVGNQRRPARSRRRPGGSQPLGVHAAGGLPKGWGAEMYLLLLMTL